VRVCHRQVAWERQSRSGRRRLQRDSRAQQSSEAGRGADLAMWLSVHGQCHGVCAVLPRAACVHAGQAPVPPPHAAAAAALRRWQRQVCCSCAGGLNRRGRAASGGGSRRRRGRRGAGAGRPAPPGRGGARGGRPCRPPRRRRVRPARLRRSPWPACVGCLLAAKAAAWRGRCRRRQCSRAAFVKPPCAQKTRPSSGPRRAARRLYCKGRILTSHAPAARRKFLRLLQACARRAALGYALHALAAVALRAEG